MHQDDRPMLGMKWKGKLYIDSVLPFGLQSAPMIFNAMADALQWVMEQHGVRTMMHYLDDYLVLGGPDSDECEQVLEVALQGCQQLGELIAAHKTEGPGEVLIFLGIELDTCRMEVRQPGEKLWRLQQEIPKWQARRSCQKRELLSLIGQLQHAWSNQGGHS